MKKTLHSDAKRIISGAIGEVMPEEAVKRALEGKEFTGRVIAVSVGKAAWRMAAAAYECLGDRIESGIVITKYGHGMGPVGPIEVYEAGHPIPDENSYMATKAVLDLCSGLKEEDTVVFLLSGGGSALFELPLIPGDQLQDITGQLLACGADIVEINTIRKRLSAVKGGRFARAVAPARVFSVILSDILGDPLDMIASGPTAPDESSCAQAEKIISKYSIRLSEQASALMKQETPKQLDNVENHVTGSVRDLCFSAKNICEQFGYTAEIISCAVEGEARDVGRKLAEMAMEKPGTGKHAIILGGETVVHLTGNGKGGRNQELALAAAEVIRGTDGIVIFAVGSDGTDGPTDAAGGIVDGSTAEKLEALGILISDVLSDNDSYNALKAIDALIITGPTGTNVNDLYVALIND